jgi:hypothetical protein
MLTGLSSRKTQAFPYDFGFQALKTYSIRFQACNGRDVACVAGPFALERWQ